MLVMREKRTHITSYTLSPGDQGGAYASDGYDDDDSPQPHKKRGRQSSDNFYDLDDPFIDDTDLLDVLERQVCISLP